MSNYRKTMTEALREMYPLDERMRMPRQLIDTNKEVMIVKKNKVIVIDKKDQDKYMKQGWELAEEVGLNEGTIDKVKEIASKKQAMKIDGVMVDSFTASAISQIYDKVNDANKKKMDSLPITKLANLAFKMMQKNDYVPEEVDLDEAKSDFEVKYAKSKGGPIKVTKFVQYDQARKFLHNLKKDGMNGIISKDGKPVKEEVDLDEADARGAWKHDAGYPDDSVKIGKKHWIIYRDRKYWYGYEIDKKGNQIGDHKFDPRTGNASIKTKTKNELIKILAQESLDEGKMQDMWQKKNAQSLSVGPFELLRGKSGVHTIKRSGKVIGDFSYDSDADNFVANIKGMRGQFTGNDIDSLFTHLQKVHKEEVDLDKLPDMRDALRQVRAEEVELDEALQAIVWKTKPPKGTRRVHPRSKWPGMKPDDIAKTWPSGKAGVEEADLDEGKMSQLHQYIKDKKSPEEIAKLMKLDVKTVKSLMSSHHPEDVEEGAAADARRAMRRDKDFSRRDSADDDTDATADDVKGASKNIMMQMRKAQSLNGRFDVEFGDGKKVKIPAKMAIAVQSKYNKMRRPAEKEKFQAKVGKSYRDMLSALKEEVNPKKESVLDRIDRKIKEKNDG